MTQSYDKHQTETEGSSEWFIAAAKKTVEEFGLVRVIIALLSFVSIHVAVFCSFLSKDLFIFVDSAFVGNVAFQFGLAITLSVVAGRAAYIIARVWNIVHSILHWLNRKNIRIIRGPISTVLKFTLAIPYIIGLFIFGFVFTEFYLDGEQLVVAVVFSILAVLITFIFERVRRVLGASLPPAVGTNDRTTRNYPSKFKKNLFYFSIFLFVFSAWTGAARYVYMEERPAVLVTTSGGERPMTYFGKTADGMLFRVCDADYQPIYIAFDTGATVTKRNEKLICVRSQKYGGPRITEGR